MVNSCIVKRRAVLTVWLQATASLKPMTTRGMPKMLTPITSSWPGMVKCTSWNRSGPFQG